MVSIDLDSKLMASKMRNEFLYKQFVKAGYLLPPAEKIFDKLRLVNFRRSACVDRSLLFPSEFIYGLDSKGHDVIPITVEVLIAATTLYVPNETEHALNVAKRMGYNASCSFQRAAIGLESQNKLPKFKAAFISNVPCDYSADTFNQIFSKRKIPVYNFILPSEYNINTKKFMKSQFEQFAKRIYEDSKGDIRMDIDKLREAIKYSNDSRKNFLDGINHMKGPGRLIKGTEFVNYNLFCSGGFGSKEFVTISKKFSKELGERRKYLETNKVNKSEKPRICLIHFPPYSYLDFLKNIDSQGDIVAAEINSIWWDEIPYDDPFEGLAIKMGAKSGVGWSLKSRSEVIHRHILEEFNIDGVIYIQHMFGTSCPLASEGCVSRLKNEIDIVNKKFNKDMLVEVVPIDCICSTSVPANVDTRIDSFFETLRLRKGQPPFWLERFEN